MPKATLKWMALSLAIGLSACAPVPPAVAPPPPPKGEVSMPLASGQSQASKSAVRYYQSKLSRGKAQGLLREDGGGLDTPFGPADLATNFTRIALYNEYAQVNGRFVRTATERQLRRWRNPIRMKVHFGASASESLRSKDRQTIRNYVNRLARLTRHPITLTNDADAANFHVFVVSLDEQRALGPTLSAVEPGLSRGTVHEITTLGRNNFCAVYSSSRVSDVNNYVSAIALIRTELPDLMRRSCYHEELAQGLGLSNDSLEARPSIFNDDEEFALLTTHDEYLLRMLYDRRLSPGMTSAQAFPIITRLAQEYLPTGS